MSVTVWIDADSCPKAVKNFVIEYSKKLDLPVIFVANHLIKSEIQYQKLQLIICDKEKDAADNYILEHTELYDIVITRDIPFADRLVEKQICVINDRGTLYTKENIKKRLSERNANLMFAQMGLITCSKDQYSKKDFSLFANCFDKEIHRLIKQSSLACK